jgi:HD-GYP domain-containing protein (c-di-GMP phosphodiesterase class II)
MKKFNVTEISEGTAFSDTVYLDNQFILAAPETGFAKTTLQALKEWEFTEMLSDGAPIIKPTEGEKAEGALGTILSVEALSEDSKINKAADLYKAYKDYMQTVFARIAQKNELDYKGLIDQVTSAVKVIKQDKHFLLRAQKTPPLEGEHEYLASHAVRCMIISIIIGNYLKLSDERLVELGIAALLHEAGMTKLPAASRGYYNKRPLTQDEKKAVFSHPVFSYNVLKSFNAPLIVCLAGLEHHERENGTGYPQKLTGDKISLYAKIIAVACSYEALTANRPHRDAKDSYAGMLELLKNEGKQYDVTIVKALLYSLSMYPMGLYVLLSNGKKGQVVDVDPENPLYPIVQVFGLFTAEGNNVVSRTSKTGVYIVRPLRKDEMGN